MAALRGDGFYIRPRSGCDRNGNKNSKEWRDKDVWHLYAADLLRAIRKINKHPFSEDAIWLDVMSALWRMAFSGASETKISMGQEPSAPCRRAAILEAPNQARDDAERKAGGSALKYSASDLWGALRIEGPSTPEALPSPNRPEFFPHD